MSDYNCIKVSDSKAVRRIAFNRPDKKNAFNVELCREFHDAIRAAATDDSVHVLLITGEGNVFTAGVDLAIFAGSGDDLNEAKIIGETYRVLADFPKVAIAAVNGYASGIGLTMLPFLDIIYAAESAFFHAPFVKLGLVTELGGSHTLTKMLGLQGAKELILRGEPIDASDALRFGLVQRVFADEGFGAVVQAIAEQIASYPAFGLGKLKELLNAGFEGGLEDSVTRENQAFIECLQSDDYKKAVAAFFQRKK